MHQFDPAVVEYETECSTGPTGIATLSAIDVALQSVQNWASTVTLWNIALNAQGGPKMGHGCDGCSGLVTIDQATGNYAFTNNYYQIGQISKFVARGAYHIASISTDPSHLLQVAFKNPDGSIVLVVHNTSSSRVSFQVRRSDHQSFLSTLSAGGIASFVWHDTMPAVASRPEVG
jgi:glucosylceramidase